MKKAAERQQEISTSRLNIIKGSVLLPLFISSNRAVEQNALVPCSNIIDTEIFLQGKYPLNKSDFVILKRIHYNFIESGRWQAKFHLIEFIAARKVLRSMNHHRHTLFY